MCVRALRWKHWYPNRRWCIDTGIAACMDAGFLLTWKFMLNYWMVGRGREEADPNAARTASIRLDTPSFSNIRNR